MASPPGFRAEEKHVVQVKLASVISKRRPRPNIPEQRKLPGSMWPKNNCSLGSTAVFIFIYLLFFGRAV